ncbi:MAG TPA: FIST N-terminal domain-containing protein [Polyangiaceae bacterium]|nr:FIST N-terminal domain-containing protein [Polyangiaceae bacterium]
MNHSSENRLLVRRAHSDCDAEADAVSELVRDLDVADASVVIFFCSPGYDLERLGQALAAAISAPLVGCTSAGQIATGGYVKGGITAVSLTSRELRVTPYPLTSLVDSALVSDIGYRAVASLVNSPSKRGFGLLLLDGLANAEELVTATLYESLGDVPIVGGSAGDDLCNRATFVFDGERFRSGAGVFVLCETSLPFATFKVQHVAPGEAQIVVTEADAERRLVLELNGKPAAAEYARLLGVPASELTPALCGEHPLVLSLGDEHFVRAVRTVNADGSLTFSCAIETGLILSLGTPLDPMTSLAAGLARTEQRVASPELVLAFDCVTRRLELERRGQLQTVSAYLAARGVVGCCTYGEQFDSFHMNQTLTGVAIGS